MTTKDRRKQVAAMNEEVLCTIHCKRAGKDSLEYFLPKSHQLCKISSVKYEVSTLKREATSAYPLANFCKSTLDFL
jgi:hypothetical protein